ncbi:hypothetical protein ACFV0D_12630 [Streptomyces sp. NPDC059556]|uniref:hypothetical protein n=1 Tax=Streptomyces sp. NPDC059556 TaxID=3346863 RepID=UPI0036A8D98C
MSFNNPIVAGTTLVRNAIKSPDYVPGVSGWSINRDGTVEFNALTSRGEVIAGSATDYVRVTASPSPHVEFMSSAAAVDFPAWLGFDADGSDVFKLEAPAFTGSGTGSTLQFDPDGTWLDVVNGNLDLSTVLGEIRLRSATIRMGGNSPASQVVLDPNERTLVTYGTDRGKGVKSYVPVTASTTLATTETVGVTSDSVLFEQNRAYRLTFHYQGSGNTANDGVGFRLRRSTVTGNSLFDSLRSHRLDAASAIVNNETSQIVVNNTGAPLTTVVVGTVYRAAGTGTVQMFANAANPVWLMIEDIGASSSYPFAKAL